MEPKDLKFKIINKSKEGCTIDFSPKGKRFLTWDAFNAEYVIVDKIYAKLSDEALNKLEELEEIVNSVVTECIEKGSLKHLKEVPEGVQRVTELIGSTSENAVKFITSRYYQVVKQMKINGTMPKKEVKKETPKQQNKPKKKSSIEAVHIDDSKKPTLGNLFTEEQLKKLKK